MKFAALLIVAGVIASGRAAWGQPAPAAVSAERLDLARQLFGASDQKQQFIESFRRLHGGALARNTTSQSDYLPPPEVVNALAKAYEHVYAENYTEDQLRGLIEFYRSPLEHTFAQNNLK
jgi:hypothetical protein